MSSPLLFPKILNFILLATFLAAWICVIVIISGHASSRLSLSLFFLLLVELGQSGFVIGSMFSSTGWMDDSLVGWLSITALVIQVNCIVVIHGLIGISGCAKIARRFLYIITALTITQAACGITAGVAGGFSSHAINIKTMYRVSQSISFILNALCSLMIIVAFTVILIGHKNRARVGGESITDAEMTRLLIVHIPIILSQCIDAYYALSKFGSAESTAVTMTNEKVHGLLWVISVIIGIIQQRERRRSVEAKISFPTTRRTQPSSSRPGRDVLDEDLELELDLPQPPVPSLRFPNPEPSILTQKSEVRRSWARLHLNPIAILSNSVKGSMSRAQDDLSLTRLPRAGPLSSMRGAKHGTGRTHGSLKKHRGRIPDEFRTPQNTNTG